MLRQVIASLTVIAMIVVLSFAMQGCTQNSPMQTETKVAGKLNILKFNKNNPTMLEKLTQVTEYIVASVGGTLHLTHENDDLNVEVNLTFLPDALNESQDITISVNDEEFVGNVDVVFGPHGLTFLSPALLNINASGLDLTGVDPSLIDVYYYEPETGEWEKMKRDSIYVNVEEGVIIVVNAQLPHFSRYAIGGE